MQSGYVVSFNERLRNEYLNEHYFETPGEAGQSIAAWRDGYNWYAHVAQLSRIPPAVLVAQHHQQQGSTETNSTTIQAYDFSLRCLYGEWG
ncbi:integrase core domain-containing protein [Chromobacterium alticapitis]|uniref:Integrase catalytic domain-containing protein n=1 Tax=Chromobacterium alticapitis TaxID=2073169 RepID=A0A2S5DG50_9NEIS|nr:hypothetical protein C2I19_10830 [Chromobacterium alticapitis]